MNTERYVGLVCGLRGAYAPRAFAGWIYDSTKRRADSGDMALDYAFVDFTDYYSSRARAESALTARLDELNGKPGAVA